MAIKMQDTCREEVASVPVGERAGFSEMRLEPPNGAETPSTAALASAKDVKRSGSLYHDRAGFGLFWALGRVSPTNYMIVR